MRPRNSSRAGEDGYSYGKELWDVAKAEATRAIGKRAASESLMSYSELTREIKAINFDPQDRTFHYMLGHISEDEDVAGRGMLTVLVVHQDGDKRPGPGFWELAVDLGRDISNKDKFWIEEMRKVYSAWSNR